MMRTRLWGQDATGRHGFLLSGGTYTTLDLPLATMGTFATGINALGQIVGFYQDSLGHYHGFLLSGDPTRIPCRALPSFIPRKPIPVRFTFRVSIQPCSSAFSCWSGFSVPQARAVATTMVADGLLGFIIIWKWWRWPVWRAVLLDVTTLRTDGNQRYSWLKTRRSLLVNVATAAQVQPLSAHQVYGCLGCNIRCGRCAQTIKQIMRRRLIAHVVHGIFAILFVALILGHIYIGTLGMEGASGPCGPTRWISTGPRIHHDLWLEDELAKDRPAGSPRYPSATPAE
jgi:probable HAF family extracellular repeat protein